MPSTNQNLGRIIPKPRGIYNPATQYITLDEVIYRDKIYRAKKISPIPTGTLPTNTMYWDATNFVATREAVTVEKYDIVAVANYAYAFSDYYDKIEFELTVNLSTPSMLAFDFTDGGIPAFPANITYNSGYVADNNYTLAMLEIALKDYASSGVKTKLGVVGLGLSGSDSVPFNGLMVAPSANITNAVNFIALNSATMTGNIVIKKYKWYTS